MMKVFLKSGLLLALFLCSSCDKAEFPSELGLEVPREPELPIPPCITDDSAEVLGIAGIQGEIENYFLFKPLGGNEEVSLKFSGSQNYLVISCQIYGGFKKLVTQRIDFDSLNATNIDMYIKDKFGTRFDLKPTFGEMYLVKKPDGSIKFDWCEIIFTNTDGSISRKSKGGFLLEF